MSTGLEWRRGGGGWGGAWHVVLVAAAFKPKMNRWEKGTGHKCWPRVHAAPGGALSTLLQSRTRARPLLPQPTRMVPFTQHPARHHPPTHPLSTHPPTRPPTASACSSIPLQAVSGCPFVVPYLGAAVCFDRLQLFTQWAPAGGLDAELVGRLGLIAECMRVCGCWCVCICVWVCRVWTYEPRRAVQPTGCCLVWAPGSNRHYVHTRGL